MDTINHGDECPNCGGTIVWSESESYNGLELRCDDCGVIYENQ